GASTTNEAKYRPAASLITVTLEGSDGRRRDHFTGTSPIFGRRSLPPAVIAKRALRVKRIACRLSLRDRKRGGATFGPFRFRTPTRRSSGRRCSDRPAPAGAPPPTPRPARPAPGSSSPA